MTDKPHEQSTANQAQRESFLDDAVDLVWKKDPHQAAYAPPSGHDYIKEFVKTVPLFLEGRLGLLGAAAAYGLDRMYNGESTQQQALGLVSGAAQGTLLKSSFDYIGSKNMNIALKGVLMGTSSRGIDSLTDVNSYKTADGSLSLSAGFSKATGSMFNKEMLGSDVFTFGASYGALRGLQNAGLGSLAQSRLFSSIMTGTVFGASTGFYSEMSRELHSGQGLNPLQLARETLISAGITGAAAAPGGLRASMRFTPSDFGPVPIEETQQNFARLSNPTDTTISLNQAVPGEKNFASYQDFKARGMKRVETPAVQYDIAGHDTKLVVPKSYDQALSNLRRARNLASQPLLENGRFNVGHMARVASARVQLDVSPYSRRYLPEDLISGLDRTPDSSLLKRINALDTQSPDMALDKQLYGRADSAYAEAFPDGRLDFYRPQVGYDPRTAVVHEWAHQEHNADPNALEAFKAAAMMEKEGYFQRSYGSYNFFENWAVHSESLLGSNEAFKKLTDLAPMRSVVLGRALKDVLAKVPADQRGPNYDLYRQRVDYIEKNVEPQARATAQRSDAGSTGSYGRAVLDYLDGKPVPKFEAKTAQPEALQSKRDPRGNEASDKAEPVRSVFREGTHYVTSGEYEVEGNAKVVASGDAKVVARDNAVVEASGQARVNVSGNAHAVLTDRAQGAAFGNASIEASGKASVMAFDDANVTAKGYAKVLAQLRSHVIASGHASIEASDNSSVTASGESAVNATDSATVFAAGKTNVSAADRAVISASGNARVMASGEAHVTALENASVNGRQNVTIDARDDSSALVIGHAHANAYGRAKVSARGTATVEATESSRVSVYDNARANVTDSVSVLAMNDAKVRAAGDARVIAWDKANVLATDNANVVANDYASVSLSGNAHADATSLAHVERRGDATVTIGGEARLNIPTLTLDRSQNSARLHPYEEAAPMGQLYKQALGQVAKITAIQGISGNKLIGGIGTGVYLNNDGVMATAFHVVDGANGPLKITGNDGVVRSARLIASDRSMDLALLKVDNAPTFDQLPEISSLPVGAGADVVAVGYPNGVSALHVSPGTLTGPTTLRDLGYKADLGENVNAPLLDTNAGTEPGNSGGPMYNADGTELLGITTKGGILSARTVATPAPAILRLLKNVGY